MNVVRYFTNCIVVFQGGGCKAISYIGAYKKAYQEGVFFSELAGTSAGSVIAALIAAGASPEYLENIVKKIDFSSFKVPCGYNSVILRLLETFFVLKQEKFKFKECLKNFPKVWKACKPYSWNSLNKEHGFFKSEVVEINMEKWLRELTGKDNVKFKDLAPNLHIIATDVFNKTVMEWNKDKTPDDSVAKAVRASCSIPIYFTPTNEKWVDGGLMSNCPDFLFGDDPNYYQMLTFRLRSSDQNTNQFLGFIDYGKQLVNTIVEGADNLQHKFVSSPNEIEIKTNIVNATDFEKITLDVIDNLITEGDKAMKEFLDQKEAEFSDKQSKGTDDFWPKVILRHQEQMHSMLSYWGYVKYDKIFVSCDDTSWSWSIFPTLLSWINNCSKVVVYIQKDANIDAREMSRRRMLEAMGCLLIMEDNMPFKGFFFVNDNGGRGVVYNGKNDNFTAKVYSDKLDGQVIHGWIEQLNSKVKMEEIEPFKIKICPINPDTIIGMLKKDKIYKKASMHFEMVKLTDLLFLNSTIRSLKYKHICHMFEIYENQELVPFSAAALEFKNNRLSYIGPPVVELKDNKLYVIEGNTRCLYAYKHGMTELMMLVVENVETPLPVDDPVNSYPIDKIIITERKIEAKNRYQGFDYSLFRHIEECLRPYDTYMKL